MARRGKCICVLLLWYPASTKGTGCHFSAEYQCEPGNALPLQHWRTKIHGNWGGKQPVQWREDTGKPSLSSDQTLFLLFTERKRNISPYTNVLILICTPTDPLWINLNKSQQETDLFRGSNYKWMNAVSSVKFKLKGNSLRSCGTKTKWTFRPFPLSVWSYSGRTGSLDFNTTRPFPVPWEQKTGHIMLFPAEEACRRGD